MASNHNLNGDAYNLEKFLKIFETSFDDVCRVLGLEEEEPQNFIEVENCIFFFDSQKNYTLSSAIVLGDTFGFYGITVGNNWLESAEKLEELGFIQASDLERFTKPGKDFNISVYLYPDDNPDPDQSKVKDYSISARYGNAV